MYGGRTEIVTDQNQIDAVFYSPKKLSWFHMITDIYFLVYRYYKDFHHHYNSAAPVGKYVRFLQPKRRRFSSSTSTPPAAASSSTTTLSLRLPDPPSLHE
jgi:hypothetical protein